MSDKNSETQPKITDLAADQKPSSKKVNEKKRRSSSSSRSEKVKREPPRPDQILVGKRQNTDYVYLLKKLLREGKFQEMHLCGKGENGNTKVIWIANRMVSWGYCTITKINCQTPSSLTITLKKTDQFAEKCEAFDVVKAERKAAREAEKAAKDAADAKKDADEAKDTATTAAEQVMAQ